MTLPPTLADAFELAAAELGFFSAARLFTGTMAASGGAELVAEMCEALAHRYPVVDAVAREGVGAVPGVAEALAACAGVSRLLVVGLEADCVDALLDALPASVTVGVVVDRTLDPDLSRVAANLEPRATLVSLDRLLSFAGSRSAMLTPVYGTDGFHAVVSPSWLRVLGPDTRTQFRSLIGWNLLPQAMETYPRWLRETSVEGFTTMVGA